MSDLRNDGFILEIKVSWAMSPGGVARGVVVMPRGGEEGRGGQERGGQEKRFFWKKKTGSSIWYLI